MRGMATLAAALLLGLGVAAAQETADDHGPPPKSQGGGWLSRLWPFGRKAEEKKPAPEPAPRRPSAAELAVTLRKGELAAYYRRQAVCLKLREIAQQTHDEDLFRRAEELENQAWETYSLRTAHLPAGGEADEGTLARRVGASGEDDGSALRAGGSGGRDGGRLAERRDR